MEITKKWLEDNHFKKWHTECYELNTLNMYVPSMDNEVFVNLKEKTIEVLDSSNENGVFLRIPFTTEALSAFISLYGAPKIDSIKKG